MNDRLLRNNLDLGLGKTQGWHIDPFGNIRDEFGQQSGFKTFGGRNSGLMKDPYGRISRRPLLSRERLLL